MLNTSCRIHCPIHEKASTMRPAATKSRGQTNVQSICLRLASTLFLGILATMRQLFQKKMIDMSSGVTSSTFPPATSMLPSLDPALTSWLPPLAPGQLLEVRSALSSAHEAAHGPTADRLGRLLATQKGAGANGKGKHEHDRVSRFCPSQSVSNLCSRGH